MKTAQSPLSGESDLPEGAWKTDARTPSGGVGPHVPAAMYFPRHRVLILSILLVGLVLYAFLPAISNDFVGIDDPDYVTANDRVQQGLTWASIRWAFRSSEAANWHPLTWLSHMLDCQLFGLHPWGHHLTSIVLHALNALLAFLVFRQMTAATWRSLLVAALFALHPLRVESVVWVAERKDVLSTTFWLLTLWAYIRYAQNSARGQVSSARDQPRNSSASVSGIRSWTLDLGPWTLDYGLTLLFFVLGLMSKPMLVTLPFVLLLLDYWPLGRFSSLAFWVSSSGSPDPGASAAINSKPQTQNSKSSTLTTPLSHPMAEGVQRTGEVRSVRALIREKIPLFVAALVVSGVTLAVQGQSGAIVTNLGLLARLQNALVSYCRYLGKVFWPVDLAVFYPYPGHWPGVAVLLATLVLLTVTCLAAMWGRRYPYLLIGWLWYLGTLVPVIGLVQAGEQSMADRYSYIPSLGIILAVVWAVHELGRRWRYVGLCGFAVLAGALAACAVLTREQIGYWKNSEALFRYAIQVTQGNYVAYNSLGVALDNQGRHEEALGQFWQALKVPTGNYLAHNNLGTALDRQGRFDEAIEQFQAAIREKPGYVEAYKNLGLVLCEQGRFDEAIDQFKEALKYRPDYSQAHDAWGTALQQQGKLDEAIEHFREALRLKPDYGDAHYNLGLALGRSGRLDEAITQFEQAIKLKRNAADAYNNLGVTLERKGRLDEAILQYRRALQFRPDFPKAHFNLGVALCRKGNLEEGMAEFKEALRLKPDYIEAQRNLEAASSLRRSSTPLATPANP